MLANQAIRTTMTLVFVRKCDANHRVQVLHQLQLLPHLYRVGQFDYRFYDSLSRLLEADYDSGTTVYNYGYDVAGNMVNYDGVTRTYNAANQMTNDGTNTLTYDSNGNLRTVGSDTYTWDRANRLLGVGNHSYVYDGLGNRVQQTVSSVVTDYLNDLQPGLTKLLKQDDGTNVEHFVHAPRGIHAVDDGTDWNFYANDGLGSVRALVDDMAVVQSSMSYDPYGNFIGTPPTSSYFGFTGEQTGSNGQIYLRKRYYTPAFGTFIKRDLLATPNRYAYVSGNPTNRVDPSGMIDWCTGNVDSGDTLGTIYSALVYSGPNSYGSTVEERFHNVLTDLSEQLRINNHPLYRSGVGNYGIVYNAGQQLYPTITNIPLSDQMRQAVGVSCSVPNVDCPPDTLGTTGSQSSAPQLPQQCSGISFMRDTGITPAILQSAAQNAGTLPVLLGMLVESEYESLSRRLEDLPIFNANVVRWASLFYGPTTEPSFGIAAIQQSAAANVVRNHPEAFSEYTNLTNVEIGDQVYSDPVFALRLAGFLVADLQNRILHDLSNEEFGDAEVRVSLGSGQCISPDNCSISERQFDDLIIIAYNQGWDDPTTNRGVLNLLRDNRSGTLDWYDGIINTIELRQDRIQNVRRHEAALRTCLGYPQN